MTPSGGWTSRRGSSRSTVPSSASSPGRPGAPSAEDRRVHALSVVVRVVPRAAPRAQRSRSRHRAVDLRPAPVHAASGRSGGRHPVRRRGGDGHPGRRRRGRAEGRVRRGPTHPLDRPSRGGPGRGRTELRRCHGDRAGLRGASHPALRPLRGLRRARQRRPRHRHPLHRSLRPLGGELAAMVVSDAVTRKLPGSLGHVESALEESFSPALGGAPEYPHYTRPAQWRGHAVPEILLSGDHARIRDWRLAQSRERLDRTRGPQAGQP
ncbi:MAG: hypothetical protein WKF31_07295 [Thermoleophilaceae bacterium]